MFKDFENFCLILYARIPRDVVLSVDIGVGGWGWPMVSSICHIGNTGLQSWYAQIVSISAVDDMARSIVLHYVKNNPLGMRDGDNVENDEVFVR